MRKLLCLSFLPLCFQAKAQDSVSHPVTVSGYVEAYYLKDFNNPVKHILPAFMYSHNRSGELTVNLAFVKVAYAAAMVRANVAIATGTYMNANLAAEPGVFKNLYEANAGVKLSRSSDLWLDAGVFASHIGFESAVGKDCWTLSRSMLADNSPYYESGAKLSYTSRNSKWYLSALVLNGWQRITRIDGNTTPAFGTQATFKPNNKLTLNSSSFIGNDKPDSVRQMRYFHNFYGIIQLTQRLAATAGFDIGMERQARGSNKMNRWYGTVLILKYNISQTTVFAVRGEYYSDKNGVIIATGTPNGFQTWGWSAAFDVAIGGHALWRLEARSLNSKDMIFMKDGKQPVNGNGFISTALAISF
ncbi:porin [Sediminibacterium soli]|uniref:porin n=1 Tax=Sediminibacterium soli TaxID=2698829 RepID=UPI00137A7920|nr:porin [Sediminibacterium soli]NCI46739.1 porin [Sediminibacterium soli]